MAFIKDDKTRKVFKKNGSFFINIPMKKAKEFRLKDKQVLEIDYKEGKIIIKKKTFF